jgi:D-beta-D-heptose 7-phosphate kinase/D-beta-D-heptose 1-phosphate adenosyltransferase
MPSEDDPRSAVERLAKAAVLVVGDVILDQWVHGGADRVAPDAPAVVLSVTREVSVPGGAGNVVRNLGALGAAVAFVSVVGDDQAGSEITGLIGGQPKLEPWLLVQGGRLTSHKTRFVSQGQQLLRVDREDNQPVHPKLAERLVRIAREAMAATSITVLSDYGKGVLSEEAVRPIIDAARQLGRKIVAGTRGPDFGRFRCADVLATGWPDLVAAESLPATPIAESDETVAQCAEALARRHELGAVVVVRTGMSVSLVQHPDAPGAGPPLHLRNRAEDIRDVSGTGDTVLAMLGAALALGMALPLAARLANLAASIVVERVGTAVVRRRELLAMLDRPSQAKVLEAELAIDRVERWRRAGLRAGLARGAFDPADPADAAVLEQARAACDRLVLALPPVPERDARAASLAAFPFVDLLVLTDGEPASTLLATLRPDLLVEAKEVGRASADLVRGWGGRVMTIGA